MRAVVVQSTLVILAGIYAMRASWFLFAKGAISPLTPVAAAAFVVCVVLFHSPPKTQIWLAVVAAACMIGFATNAALLFSESAAYQNPTNKAFSALSVAGWAVLAVSYALAWFETARAA
jgi:ABC-type polysaccharide/polyol phosphate export permease